MSGWLSTSRCTAVFTDAWHMSVVLTPRLVVDGRSCAEPKSGRRFGTGRSGLIGVVVRKWGGLS